MDVLESWLKKRPLALVLALSLIIAWLMGLGNVVGPYAMPYGDGEGYARRALTLYGFLHSGQWAAFCQCYTLPHYSTLAPPQYWLFFLLPSALASFTAYGVITALVNAVLLALGLWLICRALDRPAWTVPIFLLCASQNLSLDFSLFYFIDPTCFAFGILSFAAQMEAWKHNTWRSSFLSGACVALLFWIKPANTVLYAFFFFLAEIFFSALLQWQKRTAPKAVAGLEQNLSRHASGLLTGFLPLTFAALISGGFQVIMKLLDANETSNLFTTHLHCTGLTRLFYFPLCLAYFYHAFFMLVISLILFALWKAEQQRKPRKKTAPAPPPFPWLLLVPIALSYLIFCEYFSLGMTVKTMRSIMLVLPLLWLLIFWWAERQRVRFGLLTLGVLGYLACAYAQIFTNVFHSTQPQSESFQVEGDWLSLLPRPRYLNESAYSDTQQILAQVHHVIPTDTKLAVNSERLFLTSESLSWSDDQAALLQGKTHFDYEFQNLFTYTGEVKHLALVGARAMVLYTSPVVSYSEPVNKATDQLIPYLQNNWAQPTPGKNTAQFFILRIYEHDVGFLVLFSHPVTEAEGRELLQACGSPDYEKEGELFLVQHNRYLTWADCVDILQRWYLRHFGPAPTPAP